MLLLIAIVLLTIVVVAPSGVAGEKPPGQAFSPWHGNLVTPGHPSCEGPLGDVPAGPVDIYANGGPEVKWVTPAGASNGPWTPVRVLWWHIDVYAIDPGGSGPGAWVAEDGKSYGVKDGLGPGVICGFEGTEPLYPDLWGVFSAELIAV